MASIHDKLNRVRKPRVHITYDLESNGESVKRELPFVMGVMGDYSGDNTNQKAFKDRNFLQVDRDNINEIMTALISLIDNPEITINELMEIVKGPDFPTGASICGTSGIRSAYVTGRGRIIVKSKTKIINNIRI